MFHNILQSSSATFILPIPAKSAFRQRLSTGPWSGQTQEVHFSTWRELKRGWRFSETSTFSLNPLIISRKITDWNDWKGKLNYGVENDFVKTVQTVFSRSVKISLSPGLNTPLEPQRHITENSCLLKESRSSLKYSRRLSESESVFSSDHRIKVKAKLTVDAENFDEAWFCMDLGSGLTVFLAYETVSDLHVDNIPNVRLS